MASGIFMSRKECNKCVIAIAFTKCRIPLEDTNSVCNKRCSRKSLGTVTKRGEKKDG